MPYQKVQILFGQGVDEKTEARLVPEGKLLECKNVVFDKKGTLNKRHGYLRVTCDSEVFGHGSVESLAQGITTYQGELFILGRDFGYSLVSRDAEVETSRTIVLRGRIPNGVVRKQVVTGSGGGNQETA